MPFKYSIIIDENSKGLYEVQIAAHLSTEWPPGITEALFSGKHGPINQDIMKVDILHSNFMDLS